MHHATTTGRIARVALASILFAALAANPPSDGRGAHAAPSSDTIHVSVYEHAVSVPTDGEFAVSVSTMIDEPTPYLEIRYQLRTPAGRLLFQRTEVRNQVETSTVDVTFGRELHDISLQPAAYPYEVRVRTEVGEPREQIIAGTLLLHPPDPSSLPVALALRVEDVPRFDPQGLFVVDPDASDVSLQAVERVSATIISEPDLRLSLVVPPVILDEWMRVAGGYQLADPGGVVEVSADDQTPSRYREALDSLRSAIATGRLELLHVPYADPDIMGLMASGHLDDLSVHLDRGTSTYLATLETTPSVGTALASRTIQPAVLDLVAENESGFVVLPEGSMSAGETTATPGLWEAAEAGLDVLIADSNAAEMLSSADTSGTIDHLFDRALSTDATASVPIVLDVGPGLTGDVEVLLDLARVVSELPWSNPVLMSEAASLQPLGEAEPLPVVWFDDTPSGYRAEVAEARRYARAFETAVGVNDPDSQAVTVSSLIAQSRSWAGPDGRWSMADRGRSFSSAATRHARSFLDMIEVTAQDVTLAGPRGEWPLSIINHSTKNLTVTLNVSGEDGVHFADGTSESITLRPQENFHTVGVDLQSSLSSVVEVEIWSADVLLTSASATVRASYLDRLAMIGGVSAVLIGLLYYIRRRMRAVDAGKIPPQT